MDDKNLTIGDIARELGVSKTTVSRAISGKGRIGEETRRRVLTYIEERQYRPNVIAKGLAQNKTYNIGLVLPGDYNIAELPFFQSCMVGISRVASKADYDVMVLMVTAGDCSQLERAVTNHKIDGIILTRTLVDDKPLRYLKEKKIPFVVIGSTDEEGVTLIDNDHRNACKELTERLLESGIGKIALIGGDESHVVTRNRLLGFEEAFLNLPRQSGQKKIFLNVENGERIGQIVKELLENGTECIVTMDDFLCGLVLNSLQQMQVLVPKQIKVASFYDSVFLANYIPPVTSVHFDVVELGRRACGILLKKFQEKKVESQTLLGYEIWVRESTM